MLTTDDKTSRMNRKNAKKIHYGEGTKTEGITKSRATAGFSTLHRDHRPLTVFEKKFLLCVERGDVVSVRNFLENHKNTERDKFSIDCVDPLGRTALILAIENENIDLIDVLLKHKASPRDALLHAISEEYVEAVETLLRHEERIHVPNTPYVSISC